MINTLLLAGAAAALALPAPQPRAGAIRAECKVRQVHTPAGKLVHNAPIVSCPAVAQAAARPAAATPASTR